MDQIKTYKPFYFKIKIKRVLEYPLISSVFIFLFRPILKARAEIKR